MHRRFFWMLALAAALTVGGCEENVTAVTGTEMAFTVYGLLSPDRDVQKALVYPIEGELSPRGAEPLDAVVRSTDLRTDQTLVWQDSLVTDTSGLIEHVFQAPFRAAYGHTYRLTIEGSDGRVTQVETAVPPRTDVVTGSPTVLPAVVTLPAIVTGGAPRLLKTLITYYVTYRPVDGGPVELDVPIAYGGEQEQTPDGWVVPIQMVSDYETVEQAAAADAGTGLSREYGIRIHRMRIQLIVASDEWDPPNGEFDPEVVVQPGTMSNVENGYGFVAAGYRLDRDVEVPGAEALEAAGFTPLP